MIRKIIVFGGGTSGWLSAAYLRNNVPDAVEIQVIESTLLGIVGVGEGTQPYTTQFLRQCGLTPQQWMKDAKATYKLGVEFTGWHDNPYFVDNDSISSFLLGPGLTTHKYWLSKDKKEFFDWIPSYRLAKENKSPKINPSMDFNFGYEHDTWDAVHFDAYKIGETLKGLLKDRVDVVDTKIVEVDTDENGVTCLRDEGGIEYVADLFIDCTGFKSILLEKTMQVRWVGEEENLPCNRAVAIPTQYTNPQEECHPYTKATTMKHGWRWTIPTFERIGNGYVYSDKHCTPEEAEAELREALGEYEAEARHLEMRIGTHEGVAHGNVVAVGLSGGFVEPLEATGITFTTKTLEYLLGTLVKSDGVWGIENCKEINHNWLVMFYEIRDFIFLHYRLANRSDTDFWKEVTTKEFPDTLRERIKSFMPNPPDSIFVEGKYSMFHTGQWLEMLIGSDFYSDTSTLMPKEYEQYADLFVETERAKTDKILEIWPNHYDYLKKLYEE
jgi:hypothetical protein